MKAIAVPPSGLMKCVARCSLALVALVALSPAGAKTLEKAPQVKAMQTKIMNQSLVQGLVRVGDRVFLAGERGHIGWSDDGGKTWQQAEVPSIQTINAIYFATKELGWAVGYDENIFHTTDGGKTWKLQLDGLAFNIQRAKTKSGMLDTQIENDKAELDKDQKELDDTQAALDQARSAPGKKKDTSKLQATIDKLNGAIDGLQSKLDELDFQKRDSAKTLETENAPWPLMDVWFSDIKNGFAVGAFNNLLITTDGGETWQDCASRLDNPEGYHLNAVAGSGSTVFIVGEAGVIFRSSDGGATWKRLESPDQGSFFAIHISPQEKTGLFNVLVAGLRGATYRSSDSGQHWEKIEHSIGGNLNGILVDPSGLVLIVGNDGAVLRSTDAGKTFTAYTLTNRTTMGSAALAPNGDYLFGGVNGVQIVKPADLTASKK